MDGTTKIYWETANKVKPGGNAGARKSISTLEYIFVGQNKILTFKKLIFIFCIVFGIIFELSSYIILTFYCNSLKMSRKHHKHI